MYIWKIKWMKTLDQLKLTHCTAIWTRKKTGIFFCSGHFEKYTRRCSVQKRNDRNKNLYWLTMLNILFLFERINSKGETRWKISFTAKCERFKENWHQRPHSNKTTYSTILAAPAIEEIYLAIDIAVFLQFSI